MEAVVLPDQPISSYKSQIRTPKKGMNRPFISRPSENFAPVNLQAGFLRAPPPPYLSYSYPPFSLQQQPPLLPLPMSGPHNPNNTTNPRVRGLSCSPTNRKSNNNNTRTRDSSLTPKKSKPLATTPKKEENLMKPISRVAKISSSESVFVSSTNPLGPDPKDLPKDVPKILSLSLSGNSNISTYTVGVGSVKAIKGGQVDEFSGSVAFTLSPPPSSLPLPTFSLRPKLSCNAEAAGIDAGATDNLRRLLRL